jgi:hypothetical protein
MLSIICEIPGRCDKIMVLQKIKMNFYTQFILLDKISVTNLEYVYYINKYKNTFFSSRQ